MDTVLSKIKKQRNLKDSSLVAYKSALKRIEKIQGSPLGSEMTVSVKKLQEGLKKIPITSRKNLLTSLIVALNAVDKKTQTWSEMLTEEDTKYRAFLQTQKKTEKQAKNWITIKEVNSVKNKLKKEARDILKSKAPHSGKDFQTLQDYFVIMFLSYHHTRLDLTDVHYSLHKTRSKNKNWLTRRGRRWQYELNVFKTAKFTKDLPVILKAEREESWFLNRFTKIIPDGNPILKTQKGKKYTRAYLGRRVVRIFQKYLKTKKSIS